jgi:hypothetical protein
LSQQGNGPDAGYDGEVGDETYTVQVFPAVAGAAKRGKRRVLLRVRYRGKTQDFVEEVPRSYTELYIRTVVRRLIAEYWPS